MADFLAGMAIAAGRRVRHARRCVSDAEMRARAADAPPAPPLVLSAEGFDVIAEVKRRAPGDGPAGAAGRLNATREPALPARLARAYADGGAAAVSVLTEPLAFGGHLADLVAAGRTLRNAGRPIPTMRKDFLVDPYQMFEARAAGAGGALLIVGLPGGGGPGDAGANDDDALLDAAAETGLWVLVEAFGDAELEEATRVAEQAARRGVGALLGVNVRNLRTLAVDRDRLARLAPRLPADVPAVAESGLRTPAEVAGAARLGYRLGLIGRALGGSSDPRALLARMLEAGRAARREAA